MGSTGDVTFPGYITLDYGNHRVPVNKVTLVTFLGSARVLQILMWSILTVAVG